jgi:hypothetical protein
MRLEDSCRPHWFRTRISHGLLDRRRLLYALVRYVGAMLRSGRQARVGVRTVPPLLKAISLTRRVRPTSKLQVRQGYYPGGKACEGRDTMTKERPTIYKVTYSGTSISWEMLSCSGDRWFLVNDSKESEEVHL